MLGGAGLVPDPEAAIGRRAVLSDKERPELCNGQAPLVADVDNRSPELRAGREARVVNLDTLVYGLNPGRTVVPRRPVADISDRAFPDGIPRQTADHGLDLTCEIDTFRSELFQGHDPGPLVVFVLLPIFYGNPLEDWKQLGLDQAAADSIPLKRSQREEDQEHPYESSQDVVDPFLQAFMGDSSFIRLPS